MTTSFLFKTKTQAIPLWDQMLLFIQPPPPPPPPLLILTSPSIREVRWNPPNENPARWPTMCERPLSVRVDLHGAQEAKVKKRGKEKRRRQPKFRMERA